VVNYYFVAPLHQFTISQPENVLALSVFVVIAALVSRVVDMAARRTSEAARSNAEAETMSTLAGSVLRGEQAIPALLERVRETFAVDRVSLLRRDSSAPASEGPGGMRGSWTCLASVGDQPCTHPEDGDAEAPVGPDLVLVLGGRAIAAEDQRVLNAFAAQVAVAFEQRRLAQAADAAAGVAEADRMRTALLNAVSHDLRTPIASAKAAISSLRSGEVRWSPEDRQELLATADDALDRLTDLVTNLLDLSRLQAGVLSVAIRPVGVDEVVGVALDHVRAVVPDRAWQLVQVDVPSTLPEVAADAGLLERVIANLVENALRHTPPDQPVRLAASAIGNVVEVRVIDRGPGIPADDRSAVFAPFQRLDDHGASGGTGVGLGLAIARGFVEAMHGTVTLDDTPGGGLTATVGLPIASGRQSSPDEVRDLTSAD